MQIICDISLFLYPKPPDGQADKGGGKMLTLLFMPVLLMLFPLFLIIGIFGLMLKIGFSVLGWILKGAGGFILLLVILALVL